MAKHLGSRPRSRLFGMPGRVVWGLGVFVAVNVVTVLVVVAGVASREPLAVLVTAADGVDAGSTTQVRTGVPAASRLTPTARHSDLSRQAARPELSPYRVRHGASLALKPAAALARKVADLSPASSTFTIAQSNVLGSQHTAGRGGYGPGTTRAAITSSLLTSRGVDVGGMEEVQSDQLGVFLNRMPGYSFWPAAALGHNGERLQIYWRSSRFALMDQGSVTYVFSSQHIPLPYVLLRDRVSGAEFYVITAHNSPGGMEVQRDVATGIEIALIRRLMATGRPVLITGDMNEHTEFFCKVAVATGMVAANGGSGAGGCHLPPGPLRVDWIMGGHGVGFSGYRQDGAGLRRASDHYYLYATATATSRWYAP
ncbi:MAG: endonuclease/exonuclease/phosphatase family protein [Nocardioides sp.]